MDAIRHPRYEGWWMPYPVEYKRGKPKRDEIDEVQLAAQVMCLEEMYSININQAALFYGETNHRLVISINKDLRNLVKDLSKQMHSIFKTQTTPKAEKKKCCRNCSLQDICIPELSEGQKASNYLKINLYADIT